jgi:SIR2-like domain
MAEQLEPTIEPYKFLDYYGLDDSGMFFGRERETEILLSDIVASRLVILFAKTGTGKSSLINAGVRPRLHELDYATFWFRVETDAAEAARKAMRDNAMLPQTLEGRRLAEQLDHVVKSLDKPIVLFFDQFEEFFLSQAGDTGPATMFRAAAKSFIQDVGQIYRKRDAGVHIVFSMREEYFHEMSDFRDEIPSIFRNDSMLRLRWFDDDQAREAIARPAERVGAEFEEHLIRRLISEPELKKADGIEPARLQIVCDTLWRKRADPAHITGDDYDRLGGAKRILDSRLEEDIEAHFSADDIVLFEKLVPSLSTSRNTKLVRGVDELVQTLQEEPGVLNSLIETLVTLRLVRRTKQYNSVYIEWTSDYLAGRAIHLRNHARVSRLRWLIRDARKKAERKASLRADEASDLSPFDSGSEDEFETLYVTREDFKAISTDAQLLAELDAHDAQFLLRVALAYGEYLELWFRKAIAAGIDAWQILRGRILQKDTPRSQALNAVLMLGNIAEGNNREEEHKALELLQSALDQPHLAKAALEALAHYRPETNVPLFAKAIEQPPLARKVIDLLREIKSSDGIQLLTETFRGLGPNAVWAGTALVRIAGKEREAIIQAREKLDGISSIEARMPAREALDRVLAAPEAASQRREALERALADHRVSRQLREALDRALIECAVAAQARKGLDCVLAEHAADVFRLALQHGTDMFLWFKKGEEYGVDVWQMLNGLVSDQHVAVELAKNAVQLLPALKDPRATELLEIAGHRQGLRAPAEQARKTVEERALLSRESFDTRRERWPVTEWRRLVHLLERQTVVPIIGLAADRGVLSAGFELARQCTAEFEYPFEDSDNLARVAQFVATVTDHMSIREKLLDWFAAAKPPDFNALDSVHGLLADLPLPIYITTAYDDYLIQALKAKQRDPRQEFCRWNRLISEEKSVFGNGFIPTKTTPVVFHLFGHRGVPESIVIAEDDYLDFLRNTLRESDIIPIEIRRRLSQASPLFLGYHPADLEFRVLIGSFGEYLSNSMRGGTVQLQLGKEVTEAHLPRAQDYLSSYFRTHRLKIYWGTAREMLTELQQYRKNSAGE